MVTSFPFLLPPFDTFLPFFSSPFPIQPCHLDNAPKLCKTWLLCDGQATGRWWSFKGEGLAAQSYTGSDKG